MKVPKRDVIATVLVAAAAVLYVLWATDSTLPGLSSTRSTGIAVLALGFAASASAVVPGFDQLMHGNRGYLVLTAAVGLAAFVGGLLMLVADSEPALAVLMLAMGVLWVVSTVHHVLLARTGAHPAVTHLRH